jgi:hypothetical protein
MEEEEQQDPVEQLVAYAAAQHALLIKVQSDVKFLTQLLEVQAREGIATRIATQRLVGAIYALVWSAVLGAGLGAALITSGLSLVAALLVPALRRM